LKAEYLGGSPLLKKGYIYNIKVIHYNETGYVRVIVTDINNLSFIYEDEFLDNWRMV
jgi:hypothetical protein